MQARAIRLLLSALAALAVAACTPDGGTIYYVLEHEVKTVDNTLPNEVTAFDIVAAAAGGPYYAAAGTIWEGTAGAGTVTWDTDTPVAPPAPGALCNALAYYNDTLWGGFVEPSGNLGLYRSSLAPVSFAGQVAEGEVEVDGKQAIRLKVVNGLLAIVTADSGFAYQLYTTADGSTYSELALTGHTATEPIRDVEYFPFDGFYYATSGTKLYAGAGPLGDVTATLGTISASDELRDLFSDGTALYLTTKLGALYLTTDGTSWTKKAAPAVSGKTPALTALAGPVDGDILVGSDGYGYYLFDGASLQRMSSTTYSTVEIYGASVRRFLLDPAPPAAPDRLFVGTAGGGLWRAESPGATMTWIRE